MSLLDEVLAKEQEITYDFTNLRSRLVDFLAKAISVSPSTFSLKNEEPYNQAVLFLQAFGLVVSDRWYGRPGEDPYYLQLLIDTPDGLQAISRKTIKFLKDPEKSLNG